MASVGPSYPATVADLANGDGWTNPNNVKVSDGTFAVGSSTSGGLSLTGTLKNTAFGFSIPSGATINGISVEVNVKSSGASTVQDDLVRLYKAGTLVGSNLGPNTTISTSSSTITYGGSANLWGTTWSYTDINDSGFGVGIGYTQTSFLGAQASVDFVRITITYTPLATDPTQTGISSVTGISAIQF